MIKNSDKDEAKSAVRRVLKGEATNFELVPFERYNRIVKLRSPYYHGYLVVCYGNTLRPAGWLVCKYATNRKCQLELF